MVVKRQNDTIPKSFLINAGAALFCITTAALVVRSSFSFAAEPTCQELYSSSTVFALRSASGERHSPIDLQTRIHGVDWGLFENVEIRTMEHPTIRAAMRVNLPERDRARRDDEKTSGVGFAWRPDFFGAKPEGCLSYYIYLPQSFAFNVSGRLPGLYVERGARDGTARKPDTIGDTMLSVRWHRDNRIGVELKRDGDTNKPNQYISSKAGDALPRGRWVRIDQQITLNAPGKDDGRIRLFVDGDLRLDAQGIRIAEGTTQGRIAGVDVAAHYTGSTGAWTAAPKATSLALSELELLR
ncbi:MAG: polysaccharide lyase [Pseudomonadota bacterium]